MRDLLQQRKALIFRIIHRENLPWILRNGVDCRSSSQQDPGYVNIGNLDLIEKRKTIAVATYPGGTLSDYVPFYFTPFSPMAYNIKTGYHGIRQRNNAEILILLTSLPKLVEDKISFIFADRHAALATARFSSSLTNLSWIDWQSLQARGLSPEQRRSGEI
jgi:ssDNA thymidine ADP-ribosyltransferase, DarT